VWGVGRKISARLEAMGINSVRQLRDADAETIRAQFSEVVNFSQLHRPEHVKVS
jgi:DNA polymerase V